MSQTDETNQVRPNRRTLRKLFGLSERQAGTVIGQIGRDGGVRQGADGAFDSKPLDDANTTLRRRLPRLARRLRPAERAARKAARDTAAAAGVRAQPIQGADKRVYTPSEARVRAMELRGQWETDEKAGKTHHDFGPGWRRPMAWVLGLAIEVPVAYLSWVMLTNAAGNLFRMFVSACLAVAIPAGALYFSGESGKHANLQRDLRVSTPGTDEEDDEHRRMLIMGGVAVVLVLFAMAVIGLRILDLVGQTDQLHRWILTLAAMGVAVLAPYMEFAAERDNGSRVSRACVDLEGQLGLKEQTATELDERADKHQDLATRRVDRWTAGPLARTRSATTRQLEPAHRMRRGAYYLAGEKAPDVDADPMVLPSGKVDTTALDAIVSHANALVARPASTTPRDDPPDESTVDAGPTTPPDGHDPELIDVRERVGRHARTN